MNDCSTKNCRTTMFARLYMQVLDVCVIQLMPRLVVCNDTCTTTENGLPLQNVDALMLFFKYEDMKLSLDYRIMNQ